MADSADSNVYNGDSIEVLEGLEPVRRRPGMYTDTTRPNHLGMEVIDNSVDEALAGYADKIEVILHKDQSLEVADNGRGMPVDIHSVEKVPAVELIFGKLHAGGKFSNKNYAFSGGLHGVGVSVVNALSTKLEAEIKRLGSVLASGYLGTMYAQGAGGLTKDMETAVKKWTVGAKNGHKSSIRNLIKYYQSKKNNKQVVYWKKQLSNILSDDNND